MVNYGIKPTISERLWNGLCMRSSYKETIEDIAAPDSVPYLVEAGLLQPIETGRDYKTAVEKRIWDSLFRMPRNEAILSPGDENIYKKAVDRYAGKSHPVIEENRLHLPEGAYQIEYQALPRVMQDVAGSSVVVGKLHVMPNLGPNLYHATRASRVERITAEGIRPGVEITGDQCRQDVFLTPNPKHGISYAGGISTQLMPEEALGYAVIEIRRDWLRGKTHFVDDFSQPMRLEAKTKSIRMSYPENGQVGYTGTIPPEAIVTVYLPRGTEGAFGNILVSKAFIDLEKPENANRAIAEHKAGM